MVDPSDQVSNGGNATPNNVETLMFEGKEVVYSKDDSGISVEMPEGLTEEEETKFRANVPSLVAKLNKNNFDANRAKEELAKERENAKEREKLLQDKLDFERQRNQILSSKQSETPSQKEDPFIIAFGTDDPDKLIELQNTDPVGYARMQAEYNRLIIGEQTNSQLSNILNQNAFDSQVLAEGYNPAEVKAFLNSNGFADREKGFAFFKMMNEKPTIGKTNVRQEVQEKAANILPSGSIKPKATNEAKMLKELKSLQI